MRTAILCLLLAAATPVLTTRLVAQKSDSTRRTIPAEADQVCKNKRMNGERRFDTAQVRDLAGEYRLAMVVTTREYVGEKRHGGRLTLWVQDSAHAHRSMFGPLRPGQEAYVRPLAASLELLTPPLSGNESDQYHNEAYALKWFEFRKVALRK